MNNAKSETEANETVFAVEGKREMLADSPAIQKLISEELIIIRHLEDKDDLSGGRDTPLAEGQLDKVQRIANEVVHETLSQGYKGVLFCTSPRKRVVETVQLVHRAISEMGDPVKVITTTHEGLIDLDHGEFVLPADYRPGDRYEPFTQAWVIFTNESFGEGNKRYHFGDPVKLPDGGYKYPEIAGHFTRFGETYSDFAIRLYSAALDLADNIDRYGKGVKLVVMTHGASLAVYRDIEAIALDMMTKDYSFETGSLMDLCWARYNSRVNKKSSEFGKSLKLSVRGLLDPVVVEKLREEVSFLKAHYQTEQPTSV